MTNPAPVSPELAGRVALVTGANHGIGAATAIDLARRGADVAITWLAYEPAAEPGRPDAYAEHRRRDGSDVLAAIEAEGRRAFGLEVDLADPSSPAELFEAVTTSLGPVDIVVHNASGWLMDTFSSDQLDHLGRPQASVSASSFEQQFAVDARAGALLIAEFASRHRARNATWGRIVTLTSGHAVDGFPSEVSYGAAKAALVSYTMSAAKELADCGVTANVLYPPVTDTGWITPAVESFVEQDDDHVHIAEPHSVGGVIGWMCTPEADLLTGNVVRLR